jgi:hypothetical protein
MEKRYRKHFSSAAVCDQRTNVSISESRVCRTWSTKTSKRRDMFFALQQSSTRQSSSAISPSVGSKRNLTLVEYTIAHLSVPLTRRLRLPYASPSRLRPWSIPSPADEKIVVNGCRQAINRVY